MADREPLGSEQMLQRLAALINEKRGEDLVAIDVREFVEYMDTLLIATARSERQARAIADHVLRSMKKAGIRPLSGAGLEPGSWICIDMVDVVVHVFTPETRKHYDLELLWGDAPRLELNLPAVTELPASDDQSTSIRSNSP